MDLKLRVWRQKSPTAANARQAPPSTVSAPKPIADWAACQRVS